MISPEILRRYPFFGELSPAQLKAVAMISEIEEVGPGVNVTEEGKPANYFYLLIEGDMDLYFAVAEEQRPDVKREYSVGHINPEEVFGLSAIINPDIYTVTARTAAASKLLRIDAAALHALCELDVNLAYHFMLAVARSTMDRLTQTRIQLAAAWA